MSKIYDGYGNPYTPSRRPETREIAITRIQDRYSTYPSSGLTPERLASIFKQADIGYIQQQAELFEEMEEKDTHLFSVLQTRKQAVTGCSLEVVAASDSAPDKKIAEFVKEAIGWIDNWDDALLDLLDAIGKGFAAPEIMWEIAEGKAWVRELKWRHQKQFTFWDTKINLQYPRLLTDQAPTEGIALPPHKFLIHRYRARSGNTSRAGLLRTCAWMYLFKNYDIKDWIVFAEIYGMPLRVGRYDPGTSKEDREVLIQAVQSLSTDAAAVISKSTEIEFVETAKGSQGNNIYDLLAAFCNKELSKAVLGQTASTEGTPGKLGNETAQDNVRQDLKEADAKALAKTLKMQLVRPLVGFNFGWDTALPDLKLIFEEAEDLQATATTYKTLVEAGFDGIPKSHIHEKFGIPLPKEGEETLQPPATQPSYPFNPSIPQSSNGEQRRIQGLKDQRGRLQYSFKVNNGRPRKDPLDPYIERALEAGAGPMEDLIQPVRDLILNADSFEEIRNGLSSIYPDMDPEEMANLMQRVFALAYLLGSSEVKNGR